MRGIFNYVDSIKNDQWRPYAAATAASYAKSLLSAIDSREGRSGGKGKVRRDGTMYLYIQDVIFITHARSSLARLPLNVLMTAHTNSMPFAEQKHINTTHPKTDGKTQSHIGATYPDTFAMKTTRTRQPCA